MARSDRNRSRPPLPLFAALILALWPPLVGATESDVLGVAHAVVDDYRRIVVLMSEPALAETDAERTDGGTHALLP